MKQPNLE